MYSNKYPTNRSFVSLVLSTLALALLILAFNSGSEVSALPDLPFSGSNLQDCVYISCQVSDFHVFDNYPHLNGIHGYVCDSNTHAYHLHLTIRREPFNNVTGRVIYLRVNRMTGQIDSARYRNSGDPTWYQMAYGTGGAPYDEAFASRSLQEPDCIYVGFHDPGGSLRSTNYRVQTGLNSFPDYSYWNNSGCYINSGGYYTCDLVPAWH